MQYASLKISVQAKRELEALQADLRSDLGEKISQGELVERLIRLGHREKLRLLEWKPLSEDEIREAMNLVVHGTPSRGEAFIDEDIYGGRK